MTPPPLTQQQRLELLTRMEADEKALQEEWGTNWEKLRDDVEKSVDTVLTNPQ